MIPVRELHTAADIIANYKRTRGVFFCPRKIALAQVMAAAPKAAVEKVVEPETPKPPMVFPEDLAAWQEAAKAKPLQSHSRAMDIVRAHAVEYGVTVEGIFSTSCQKKLIEPRFKAILAVHEALPEWSLPKLGQFFADRDHTTILHAIRRAKAKRESGEW